MKNGLSDKTTANARKVLDGKAKRPLPLRILPFLGPAFVASVAYVDPGNFATNIQAGSEFGYLLLWVIVICNIMAMVIQTLSAKLGIATGKNLAEHCRERFPKAMVIFMWVAMEIVAMATDLAEFLGAALGFQLLFGIPLIAGGFLTAITTFAILGFERRGFRPYEAIITSMVGIIAICYLVETIVDRPDWGALAFHSVTPQFHGPESVLIAAGILGATVMPHAIFLHSALMQNRIIVKSGTLMKKIYKYEIADIGIAMTLAGLVNMAILIMAASAFHSHGFTSVATIEQANITLQPLLGKASGWIFAVSLLASGLSSSTVGTGAGQIIMQGFVQRHIPAWIRRIATFFPSLIVIAIGLDPTRTLVISQVILSFGLPFAVVPLVLFTSNKKIMGELVNARFTTLVAIGIAILIVVLNIYLLYQTFRRA